MDDFDDFGISDDVLNELFDLQRGGGAPPPPAPSPPAEPLPPPPAEWQQPPTEWQQPPPPDEHVYPNMFEDFDAPGPLQPQDHSAVTALPAYEGHEGHAALDVQQLRGELEQAIRQRQEALNDKQQLEGERMILRSKLEQASQGGVHERQQLQHLKSQLDGIRAEKHMEYDSTVNKLKTDLSFKSQELEAVMRENAQLKAQAAEQQQAPGQAARLPTAGGARPRGGALTPHALRTPRPLCDSGSVPPQPGIGHPLPPPLATLGQQQSNASPLFRPTPGAASRKRSAGSGSPSKAAPPPSAAAPLLPQQPRAQTPSPAASTSRTPDANQQQQQQQAPLFTPAPRDRPSAHRPSGLPVPPPTAALLAVAPTDESDESPAAAAAAVPRFAATPSPMAPAAAPNVRGALPAPLAGPSFAPPVCAPGAATEASPDELAPAEEMEVDCGGPAAVAAPADLGRPTSAWRSWREDASLLLAARIMGAGEHSSLQRLLLEPVDQPSGGAGREGGDVALRLLGALQLLLSGVEHAPHLLLAVQPLLTLTPQPAASSAAPAASPRCCRLCCALRLVCLLLGESVHCRRSSLQPHLPPPPHATTSSGAPPAGEDDDAVASLVREVRDGQPRQRRRHATEAAGGPAVQPARWVPISCVEIVPRLMELVELLCAMPPASTPPGCRASVGELLLPAVRSLSNMLWSGGGLACAARFAGWLAAARPAQPSRGVFARLLGAALPWRVRLQSAELLHAVLRSDAAVEAFLRPPDELGAGAGVGAGVGAGAGAASPAMQLAAAIRLESGQAQEGAACGDEAGDEELGLRPLSRHGAAVQLSMAALRLFSSLQLSGAEASRKLLEPALKISLPVRPRHVRTFRPSPHPPPTHHPHTHPSTPASQRLTRVPWWGAALRRSGWCRSSKRRSSPS